jgi:hypothetical protein
MEDLVQQLEGMCSEQTDQRVQGERGGVDIHPDLLAGGGVTR